MSVRLFDLQTDPAGGGEAVAEPEFVPTPHPNTVVAEPEPAVPAEPEGPSVADLQAALEEQQQQLEYMRQFMPQVAFQQPQQPQQEQGPPVPDPFADDYAQQFQAYTSWVAQQAVAPYQQAAQTWQLTEGEQRRDDILADDVAANGDLLVPDQSKEMINGLADVYYNAMASQLGEGPETAQKAIAQSIADVRAYEARIAEEAVTRYRNQMAGLRPGAQLPANGVQTGAQTFPMPSGLSSMDLVRKYTSGQGLPG